MEMLVPGVTVQPHWYRAVDGTPFQFEEVKYHGHTYLMLEQSWDQAQVKLALDRMNLYPSYPVVVDPYNSAISYGGPRPRARLERTSAGEQIEIAGVPARSTFPIPLH